MPDENKDMFQEREQAITEAEKIFKRTREGTNPLAEGYKAEDDPNRLKVKAVFSEIAGILKHDGIIPGPEGYPPGYQLPEENSRFLVSFSDENNLAIGHEWYDHPGKHGFYDAYRLSPKGSLHFYRREINIVNGDTLANGKWAEEAEIGGNGEDNKPEIAIELIKNVTNLLKQAVEKKRSKPVPISKEPDSEDINASSMDSLSSTETGAGSKAEIADFEREQEVKGTIRAAELIVREHANDLKNVPTEEIVDSVERHLALPAPKQSGIGRFFKKLFG